MLVRHIKYKDYNGKDREEDFYFNINADEIIDVGEDTSGDTTYNRLKTLVTNLKDFILKAYGEKSIDGRRFVKTKEATDEFAQTKAFSDLYLELLTKPEEADDFVNKVLDPELVKIFDKISVENGTVSTDSNKNNVVSIDSKKG